MTGQDLAARLDEILGEDLSGRVKALLPTIELLVPMWSASEWNEEPEGRPLLPAFALLRRVATDEELDGVEVASAATACLEHLAMMGEGERDEESAAADAAPSMAVGLVAFLLAEAADHFGEDVDLPSELSDVLHGGIPHLLSVLPDPAPVQKALGL